MKKNVYRNFDFVVRQTDKMKAIQKIAWNAFFFRFLPFIDSSLVYSSNEISTFEKKSLFLKNEGDDLFGGHSVQATSNRLIHAHISFIHCKRFPPRARRPERKHPNFGHFLPIWGISWPLTSYLKRIFVG